MPELLRRIILEIDSRRDATGYSEVVLQLLDCNGESRKQFVAGFEKIRKRALKDKKQHDATMVFTQSGAGITCFAALSDNASTAMNRLVDYVQLKKYQQHANSWVGLLTIVDRPGLIHGFTVSTEPWSENEELEKLSSMMPVQTEH